MGNLEVIPNAMGITARKGYAPISKNNSTLLTNTVFGVNMDSVENVIPLWEIPIGNVMLPIITT